MSDPSIPLSMLTQFHRDVVVPDIERIVGASERRLRDETRTLHDGSLVRLEGLELESAAIEAGLRRVEGRLDSLVDTASSRPRFEGWTNALATSRSAWTSSSSPSSATPCWWRFRS